MGGTGKILVIKPSSLGDVVHTFPALELLRRAYPDAELDFVIHPALAELLDLSPFPVRKKIYFNRRELGSLLKGGVELFRLIREIRREEYELVVDFQGLFRSGFLSGISRSCITAGFTHPREKSAALFYNRKITNKLVHRNSGEARTRSGFGHCSSDTTGACSSFHVDGCQLIDDAN